MMLRRSVLGMLAAAPAIIRPAEAQTDDRGSYHFSLATKGSCKLTYQSGSVQAQTDVIVDPNPTQYDFDIVMGTAGARLVRR